MNSQKGFTLIEILVVILILGMLAAFYGHSKYAQTEGARLNAAKLVLQKKLPVAIQSYYSTHSYDDPPTKQDLVDRGVPLDTPWNGASWYVLFTPMLVRVHYPMGNGQDNRQSMANAIDVAKDLVSPGDMQRFGTPDNPRYSISRSPRPEAPFVGRVRIKDLARDSVSGAGVVVSYLIRP